MKMDDSVLLVRRSVRALEGPRLEHLELRYRRHDGRLSDVVERWVTGSGRRSVAVLAWDSDTDQVVLVEQFRTGAWVAATDPERPAPVSPWMLEVVAGSVPPGEDPAAVARKELWEEAGCEAGSLVRVGTWCADPESSASTMTLYATRTQAPAQGSLGGNTSEHEDVRVVCLGDQELREALVECRRVANSVTLVALNWFLFNGREILART
jgi:ADP-ribose pyrophosphatase